MLLRRHKKQIETQVEKKETVKKPEKETAQKSKKKPVEK